MAEFFESVMPNVYAYRDKLWTNSVATLQMFAISGIIAFVLGLVLGVALTITRTGGIKQNRVVFYIIDALVNVFRAIPFIILLIFVIPFTRALVGTAIGVKGAIVPLVLGTVPFYTRQVETVLLKVDSGKIEAARSMGLSAAGIVFRVYLHEAVPELIRVTTITAISLVGLTTMAGAVGAGGLGSFAINYGQNLHHQDIVNVCVIILLVFVCVLQIFGTLFAKKTTNRKLFNANVRIKNRNNKAVETEQTKN